MGDLYLKCVIAFCTRNLLKNTSSECAKLKTNAIQNTLREKAQKCDEMITLQVKTCHLTHYLYLTVSLQRKDQDILLTWFVEITENNAYTHAKPLRHQNQALDFRNVAMVTTSESCK